jgi:hypothetical protein
VEKPQSWHVRAIPHIEEKRHIIHNHKIDVILAVTTQTPKNIIQPISQHQLNPFRSFKCLNEYSAQCKCDYAKGTKYGGTSIECFSELLGFFEQIQI